MDLLRFMKSIRLGLKTSGSEIVKRRSRFKRWEDATAFIAGFDPEEVKRCQMSHYRTTTDWLRRVKDLSLRLGHAATSAEANKAGISCHELCKRIRGNWLQVLE